MEKAQIATKIKAFWNKIRGIKHIEIIIGVLIIAIMLIAYSGISTLAGSKKQVNTTTINKNVSSYDYTATEKRLEEVLSKIEGVGEVKVMINYNGSGEKITAKTVSTSTTSSTSAGGAVNSTTSITESPVIINNNGSSSPYVLKEISPQITGVIVVAQGADKPITKLSIMRACQTILQINATYIEIFTMK